MNTLSELQQHSEVLKKQIRLAKQVRLLKENPDFIDVILKGFCEDEMRRYMSLAVCEKLPQDVRELCNTSAKASAILDNYLASTIQLGANAEDDLVELDKQIQELQLEEGAN